MSAWRRWWEGRLARRLFGPWRMKPDIWRLEAQLAQTRLSVERMEQALADGLLDLRREIGGIRPSPVPFGCPMPDGTLLVQTVGGHRFYIDPLDRVIGPELIVSRQWEAEIGALLLSAAEPDLVFVDVGANFGYFSCLMGSRIGRGGVGQVYAVEPNPACLGLLRRNVEINWSMCPIEICACAAGDRSGVVKLYVPADHAANGYLGDAHNRDWTGFPSVDVEVRPLDEIIPADRPVDVMKIDVEGHEHAVLAGARGIIAKSPRLRVVMEWSPGQMERAGYTASQMLALFKDLGLQASRVAPDFSAQRLAANALDDDQLLALGYDNIVLTRRDAFGGA